MAVFSTLLHISVFNAKHVPVSFIDNVVDVLERSRIIDMSDLNKLRNDLYV